MRHRTLWQRGALALSLAVSGGLLGCDRAGGEPDRAGGTRTASQAADNTGRNVRDREGGAPTPMDQGESEGDRTITQHIRKSLVGNDTLSTNAQNVKIITQDGIVTLRGPVESDQERATILTAARSAPGVNRVEDELQVARNP